MSGRPRWTGVAEAAALPGTPRFAVLGPGSLYQLVLLYGW
jgi:hypothetical protein